VVCAVAGDRRERGHASLLLHVTTVDTAIEGKDT
jgi:hypothetical protein